MTITPRDIRTVTFGRPSVVRRGYSETDVDPFLEQVADELEGRLEQIDELTRQLQVVRAQLDVEPPTNPIPVPTNPGGSTTEVTEILQMAAETAARYKAEAEQRAEQTQQQAQEAAQRILANAREGAADIYREAEEQGRQTLDAYQQRADNLQVLMQGLRDKLRPYFEQNIADLDMIVDGDDETDDDAPPGAHAQGD